MEKNINVTYCFKKQTHKQKKIKRDINSQINTQIKKNEIDSTNEKRKKYKTATEIEKTKPLTYSKQARKCRNKI